MLKFNTVIYSALVAFAAVPAYADTLQPINFAPDTTAHLTDPTFIPAQGQLYGNSNYAYGNSGGNYNHVSGLSNSNTSNTNAFTQTLNYGVTNHLRLGISEGYGDGYTYSHYTNGRETQTDSFGFTDPTFSALYRVLDQNSYPVSFDVLGSYTPDVIQSKGATIANSGSVARAGQAAGFGVAVGREMKSVTVQGVAGANWNGHGESSNASNTLVSNTKSYWAPYVGVNTQTRITDRLAFNLNGRYTDAESTSGTTASNNPFTDGQYNDYNVNLGLNYDIIPSRLAAGVTYGHDFYSDQNVTYPTVARANYTRADYGVDTYGVHLTYLFF